MTRIELNDFANDMYEYIKFVQNAYHTEYEQELKIKGTLLHDLSGILSKDEHFIPRVDGMSKVIEDIKNK
tara:strand:+ start:548 stop:757 length:210 start_codon:yes stop_codon:yes gene_type:complete